METINCYSVGNGICVEFVEYTEYLGIAIYRANYLVNELNAPVFILSKGFHFICFNKSSELMLIFPEERT